MGFFDRLKSHLKFLNRRFFDYKVLNPSIIDYQGQRLIAFRDYFPFGSYVRLGILDGVNILKARIILGEREHWGAEDPRFFIYDNKLHLSYTRTRWDQNSGDNGFGKMAYCTLDENLSPVSNVVFDEFDGVQKNWLFFEAPNNQLYAITHVFNQEVFEVQTQKVIKNALELSWPSVKGQNTPKKKVYKDLVGQPRGGTTPVLVDGKFYSFFHVSAIHKKTGKRDINFCSEMGFYSFEALPPFKITAFTPEPLFIGDPWIMPQGADYLRGEWTVSCGMNNKGWKLFSFTHRDLLEKMVLPT